MNFSILIKIGFILVAIGSIVGAILTILDGVQTGMKSHTIPVSILLLVLPLAIYKMIKKM